jgi:hypothetical protein
MQPSNLILAAGIGALALGLALAGTDSHAGRVSLNKMNEEIRALSDHLPADGQLRITRVQLDLETLTATVAGEHLDNGAWPPVVTLNGEEATVLSAPHPTELTLALPLAFADPAEDGQYRLLINAVDAPDSAVQVVGMNDYLQVDSIDLSIGAFGSWVAVEAGAAGCPNGGNTIIAKNEREVEVRTEVCHGERGEKGDQGDKGDKGEQGDAGPQGLTGATGATGAIGATGPKGDKGDKGDQGEKGETGPRGFTGANGRNRSEGRQGR